MAVETVKAEQVVAAAIGLLERDTTLAQTIWPNPVGDFAGAKNDTITIKLPSYSKARKRLLRSGDARTKDSLYERTVDMKITTDLYSDVPISDEELTLDIADFNLQVTLPVLGGIVRGIDDEVVDLLEGADYQTTLAFDVDKPFGSLLDARAALNDARVPQEGRSFVVGTNVERALLESEKLNPAAVAPSSQALSEATIGRIAGFNIVTNSALDPDVAVAYHRTAFALQTRAPIVPAGAPWGATLAAKGFAIRAVRVFDPNNVEDRFIVDSWCGTNIVKDAGAFDLNGKFEPSVEPDSSGNDEMFVRAVKLEISGS